LTCAAEPLGDRAGLLGGLGDAAAQHGQAVPFEQVAPLILEQVHVSPFARDASLTASRTFASRPCVRGASSRRRKRERNVRFPVVPET
jgi:hypothetical protein